LSGAEREKKRNEMKPPHDREYLRLALHWQNRFSGANCSGRDDSTNRR
jgi:hypothetical protein